MACAAVCRVGAGVAVLWLLCRVTSSCCCLNAVSIGIRSMIAGLLLSWLSLIVVLPLLLLLSLGLLFEFGAAQWNFVW